MLFAGKNLLYEAFPQELKADVKAVIKKKIRPRDGRANSWFSVHYDEEQLQIPERLYIKMPKDSKVEELSEQQVIVYACLCSRHHDGFVRERYVIELISNSGKYPWVIPYIFRLTGEYVIEILDTVKERLSDLDESAMAAFVKANPQFVQTTKSQIISYWNCNYRSDYPQFDTYVGAPILAYLNKVERQTKLC
ncbi:hypothetical protein JOC54_000044 [Alkalihalobacillus xiaoxiensis]|uniref:Transposase n=1 Tax=Shouchella xiaoxiensis TaxID=766895 RepID=A0ABS2SMR3_9BACI|nr:hypothetical protein [Shouchella xiaoxiensis]MBM7836813.1 hypothetical protein [Shouchella xiaoxiensis]